MTITKAQVLDVVNGRLNRAETSIDTELLWALVDISGREDFITREAYRNTEAGKKDYGLPENFREMKLLQIWDGSRFTEPLNKLTFNQYRLLATSIDEATDPTDFTVEQNVLWVFPTPNRAVELRMFYTIYHPDDLDDILFPDQFREAVYQGTLMKVAEKYGLKDSIDRHLQLYEMEVDKMITNLARKDTPTIVKYKDI